jgi:serine/threonine protein kinase
MFVIGGENKKGILKENHIWCYMITQHIWRKIEIRNDTIDLGLAINRSKHVSILHNNQIYLFGGETSSQVQLKGNLVFKLDIKSFTIFQMIEVAVKELKKTEKSSECDSFDEIYTLSKVSHPNIVKFYGSTLKNQMIMEFCANGNLYDILYKNKDIPLSWPLKLGISIDVCSGLKYLQKDSLIPIIHRDLRSGKSIFLKKIIFFDYF